MKAIRWASSLRDGLGRGIFPHEISLFLELPWRNLVLSPEKLVARLGLTNRSRVLEVGAGSGFYSAAVAQRVSAGHLELLDLQPEMLKKARRKLEAEGLSNVGYTLADASRLPFREDSFDVLFLVAVLGEVGNQKAFFDEARRVLKPGGLLSISEHLPDPDFSPFAKVKSLVETQGFEFYERHGARWSYTANFRKTVNRES
ncbi:MAG TPA: class I SAM-dependent methyltransferase [Pyrinomonadaceae bacterium]|jgi:ubiquinone/menaquinone biosynthesis C-methylase UbiE